MNFSVSNTIGGIGFVILAIYNLFVGALTIPGGGVRIEIGEVKYFISAAFLYIGVIVLNNEYKKWKAGK